ncbi:hypothetical protein [Luteolibacter sp. LG18]
MEPLWNAFKIVALENWWLVLVVIAVRLVRKFVDRKTTLDGR